ncbi:MAG: hypothetical protein LBL01_01950 [Bifidobacteriaceae bacterium]|jgi:hypothetical protein|nr:hypothetical protein [Bifidobacteriaceae bacterium]
MSAAMLREGLLEDMGHTTAGEPAAAIGHPSHAGRQAAHDRAEPPCACLVAALCLTWPWLPQLYFAEPA